MGEVGTETTRTTSPNAASPREVADAARALEALIAAIPKATISTNVVVGIPTTLKGRSEPTEKVVVVVLPGETLLSGWERAEGTRVGRTPAVRL